jgi:hypothetical protein
MTAAAFAHAVCSNEAGRDEGDASMRNVYLKAVLVVVAMLWATPASAECFLSSILWPFLHGETPMAATGRIDFSITGDVVNQLDTAPNGQPVATPCTFRFIALGGFITGLPTLSSTGFGPPQPFPNGTGPVAPGTSRHLSVSPVGTPNDSCTDRLSRVYIELNGVRANSSVLIRQRPIVGPPQGPFSCAGPYGRIRATISNKPPSNFTIKTNMSGGGVRG